MTLRLGQNWTRLDGPVGRYVAAETLEGRPDDARGAMIPKKGIPVAIGPAEVYITPDLVSYPPYDLLGLEFANGLDPVPVLAATPGDEPVVLEVREGKPASWIIRSICHKAVPEHEDFETVPGLRPVGEGQGSEGIPGALRVEVMEHVLQDLGWLPASTRE